MIALISFAQNKSATNYEVGKHVHHFYDATMKGFVAIVSDSSYLIFNENSQSHEIRSLAFATDSSYRHFLEEFVPVSTSKNGTFFIHEACGIVYQFKGDSLLRHDQSFYHKNQYGGVVFEQNDEIFMYGGYGMFTEKNILVHYNQFMREWIHVEYVNDGPTELQRPFIIQHVNELYSLGGINRMGAFMHDQAQCFDFSTKRWRVLGNLSEAFITSVLNSFHIHHQRLNLSLIVLADRIIQTDVARNEFRIYKIRPAGAIRSIQIHPEDKNIVQVHFQRTGRKNHFLQVMSLQELLGENIASGKIWEYPSKTEWIISYWTEILTLLIGAAVMWVIIFAVNQRKAKRTAHSRIDFTKIDLQDLQFIALQKLFLTAPEHTVEVSAINSIVEEEGITPDTIKKRRERLIKEFSTAVAIQTGLAPTEIFLEMRHPKDKRIKLLKLSNKLITNE